MTLVIDDIGIYLLVFIRIAAMFAFDPILSRRNVTSQIRLGFSILLTILIAPTVNFEGYVLNLDLELFILILNQIFIGFCLSFVFSIFYYVLFFVGDFLDIQFGLSVAKIFDPATNIQKSLTGTYINIIFVIYFFLTNTHLILIKLLAQSFKFFPLDKFLFNDDIASFMLNVMTSVFSFSLKLILPFLVVEFILEISMGILMKLIPQIHVFIINLQIKILVAILLLLAFAHPMAEFIDKYIVVMVDNMVKVIARWMYVFKGGEVNVWGKKWTSHL